MPEIKLILTDLDGTFFSHRDDGSLQQNIAAIKAAQQAGIVVYPCTGRCWTQSYSAIKNIGFDDWIVTNNGASIAQTSTGETIYQDCLPPELASALFALNEQYRGNGIVPHFSAPQYLGFFEADAREEHLLSSKYGLGVEPDSEFRYFADAAAMREAAGHTTELVRYLGEPELLPPALLDALYALDGVDIANSYRLHLDVTKKGVSKGSVIPFLCKQHGILPENVMALGDQDNDAAMLAAAGTGIAMQDASPKAMAAADHTTDTAGNAGFAKAIYRYAL